MLEITIEGTIPSKKNSKRIVGRGKRMFIISSKNYLEWEKEKADEIYGQLDEITAITTPVRLSITFSSSTKRKWDLSNKVESIQDLLVKVGVLEDDNWSVVQELEVSFIPELKKDLAVISISPI